MQPMGDVDLVIVGGGIGGSALALVMARDGYSCLVLERTNEFPDRTRGEWLAAWGVLEARRLGVEATLRSARGHVITRHITYEPEVAPEESEANCLDLSALTPGVEGPMTQRHPDACQALFDAAASAGVPIRVQRVGSMFTVFFADPAKPIRNLDDVKATRTDLFPLWHRTLLANGVSWPPSNYEAAFITLAHGDAEMERLDRAARAAFAAVRG